MKDHYPRVSSIEYVIISTRKHYVGRLLVGPVNMPLTRESHWLVAVRNETENLCNIKITHWWSYYCYSQCLLDIIQYWTDNFLIFEIFSYGFNYPVNICPPSNDWELSTTVYGSTEQNVDIHILVKVYKKWLGGIDRAYLISVDTVEIDMTCLNMVMTLKGNIM